MRTSIQSQQDNLSDFQKQCLNEIRMIMDDVHILQLGHLRNYVQKTIDRIIENDVHSHLTDIPAGKDQDLNLTIQARRLEYCIMMAKMTKGWMARTKNWESIAPFGNSIKDNVDAIFNCENLINE